MEFTIKLRSERECRALIFNLESVEISARYLGNNRVMLVPTSEFKAQRALFVLLRHFESFCIMDDPRVLKKRNPRK